MSTTLSIALHEGESWTIPFTTTNFDNSVLQLPTGSRVDFRISDPSGPALSVSTDNAITITDRIGGAGLILIPPSLQAAANITAHKAYRFELRVETPLIVSIQAEGEFSVLPSLFVI